MKTPRHREQALDAVYRLALSDEGSLGSLGWMGSFKTLESREALKRKSCGPRPKIHLSPLPTRGVVDAGVALAWRIVRALEWAWEARSPMTRSLVSQLPMVAAEFVRSKAGVYAAEILESADGAYRLLWHDEAIIRNCALEACFFLWHLGTAPAFVNRCIEIAALDPADTVRCSAIIKLFELLRGAKHLRAQRMLAGLVADAERSNRLRSLAFTALWYIEYASLSGIKCHDDARLTALLNDTVAPLDYINWDFVNRFEPLMPVPMSG